MNYLTSIPLNYIIGWIAFDEISYTIKLTIELSALARSPIPSIRADCSFPSGIISAHFIQFLDL